LRTKDDKVQKRISSIVKNYGMTTEDVELLFAYKLSRNCDVHKNNLKRCESEPVLSQQMQDVLGLLRLAPDQPLNFSKAFERCTKLLYRRK
jgi:hypothetical protein